MKNSIFRLLLNAFTALLSFQANAQQPSFIHYGVDDGMPSNLIYAMAQDQEGFLWFATDKGLARFDGQRFHVFGMSDGLPDIEILNIRSDSKGRLWLTPFRRNPCYWHDGKFHTTKTDTFLRNMAFPEANIDFQEMPDGKIWIFGMTPSAYYLKDSSSHKQLLKDCPRKLYMNGSKLFGFGANYIIQIAPAIIEEKVFYLNDILKTNKLNFVLEGVDFFENLILYSLSERLILFEYTNDGFRVLDIDKTLCGRVFSDGNGDFWICKEDGGVVLLNCSSGKIIVKGYFLDGIKVNFIYRDRQDNVWFCTANEGFYGLPTNAPASYIKNKHLVSGNIMTLSVTDNAEIVAGDDESNIYFINGEKIRHKLLGEKKRYNRVLKIVTEKKDSLIVASDRGIYRLIKRNIYEAMTGSKDFAPKSLLRHNNRVWAARANDIGCFVEDDKFISYKKRRYTAICNDDEGFIWGGGVDGLYSQKDSFVSNWGEKFPELASRVVTMLNAGKGFIWVATPYHDLLHVAVSGGEVKKVEIMNDIFTESIKNIKCLFQDEHDNLWIGTNHGVYEYKTDSTIVHYDRHDGIADDDINTLLVQHDTLWIGTSKGLTKMLLRTGGQAISFPTFIVGIKYNIGTKSISEPFIKGFGQRRRIDIPPDANSLEIQLSGMDYASRGNIQFKCVVTEQFPSLQWLTFNNIISWVFNARKKELGLISEGKINLGSRIDPGKYVYRFTAINTRGGKSDAPDELIVVQQAYWYETIWFWLAIWAAGLILLIKLYRDRMIKRDLNASVSKLRLQALQNQMNPHFIGNSIYAIQQFFYPPDPEKASEYIEIFNRLLRQTMLMSERHFVTFSEELSYYYDYLSMIQLRFGNRFSYSISGAEHIPMATPFPAMLLQSVIENATIHGFAIKGVSELKISFFKEGDSICCIIEDNGKGINATRAGKINNIKHKSKGLEMLHQKVSNMNRLYDVEMELLITDLSELAPGMHGTRAVLRYNPEKINKQEVLTETPQ